MDLSQFVHKRKAKYMAQILSGFEEMIEPHLGNGAAGDIQAFKGLVRMRMDALALDATDVFELAQEGGALNGLAQEIRDRLSPTGRP